MDVQRGDQVYYRGEVWIVKDIVPYTFEPGYVRLIQVRPDGWSRETAAYIDAVQRVEQAR